MKTRTPPSSSFQRLRAARREGTAAMAALLLTFLASGSVVMLLRYASHSAKITRSSLDYQRARLAAESGLDYGVSQVQQLIMQYQFTLTQSELQEIMDGLEMPPSLSGYDYSTPSGEAAFRVTVDTEPTLGQIPNGTVGKGEYGEYQLFTITSGAINPETGKGAVVTQRIQATSIYLMRFGVFYWYDLEINPGPTMYFDGPIHSNHDIYLTGPLQIRAPITSHGGMFHDRKDSRNPRLGSTSIYDAEGNAVRLYQNGQVIDSSSPSWMTDSLTQFDGNAQSSSHGVPLLTPPINRLDEPYEIIQPPLPQTSEEYRWETEREKFSNKAALTIHVDANGVLSATDFRGEDVTYKLTEAELEEDDDDDYDDGPAYVKVSSGDQEDGELVGAYRMTTPGSYSTDMRFRDSRENKTVAPVDIYVDQLIEEFPEMFAGVDSEYGEAQGRGVVYITRDAPLEDNVMPAVRLRNGQMMPSGGLTVATDLPMYVEGDFNLEQENEDGSTRARQPSMVAADAVTFLSSDWQDSNSTNSRGSRRAANTTFHIVVMTGNTETVQNGQYNGGLENVLRFMEDWNGRTAYFRGSIIDLWYSQIATSRWNGSYYRPPRRDWEFDDILRTQSPPGVPRVFGIEMLTWKVTTWEEQGWN